MKELWRAIPSQPGYEVSSRGRVRSVPRTVATKNGPRRYRGRVLRPGRTPSGHLTVACGKGNSRSVHALVLEAFVGPKPYGCEALHRDDDPSNNALGNLKWGTRSENMLDRTRNGRSTLNAEQVKSIRARYTPRCRINGAVAMAAELGVEVHIVNSCLSGKNYV